MNLRARTVAAALTVVAAVGASSGWTAHAQPYAVAATADTVSPAINWLQLGLSDRVEIIGANQPSNTQIPVPSGVGPSVLTGQLGSIVHVTDGRVEVLDDRGVLLGAIPVPPGAASVPFSVDVAAARVSDGKATLSFVLRDAGDDADTCSQQPSVTLTQLTTAFSGPTPDPTTVAGFLPGYLDRIVIRTAPDPSVHQQQAALDLVARLTRLYRPMPVRIEVDSGTAPIPAARDTRVIEVTERGAAGLTVTRPGTPDAVLVISGTGGELVDQVALFTDRRLRLAQTSSAATLSAHETVNPSSTIKTFDQLDITGQTSVLGTQTLYAGFDVASFGVGPISSATVHVRANYTPVSGGEGSVLVRSGTTILASRSLDESGVLDITGDIPGEVVTSSVGLALELRYIPRQECAPLNDRLTFALDPGSTVTVTPGTNNRGGFPALPMAFTPEFDVALDSPDHLRFAAEAVNLIAQQTQTSLRPNVIPFDDAARSGSGLLVVAGGPDLAAAGMNAPMLPGDADTVNVSGPTGTLVDLDAPLGMLQAFTHNGRGVLAITGTGDWTLVDATLDHIRGLPDRWSGLTGDVVATGIAGDTVTLSINEGASMPHQPAPAQGWAWWAWASAAAVGVAATIAATVLVVRRRTPAR